MVDRFSFGWHPWLLQWQNQLIFEGFKMWDLLCFGYGARQPADAALFLFFFWRWVLFLVESIMCVPWLPLSFWWSSCFVSPVVELQAHSTMLDLLCSLPDIFLLFRQGFSVVQSGLACGHGWPWTQSFCCYLPSRVLEPCLYYGGLDTPHQMDGVLQVTWVSWHFRLPLAVHWPPCQVC